jgi:hypothetical protein
MLLKMAQEKVMLQVLQAAKILKIFIITIGAIIPIPMKAPLKTTWRRTMCHITKAGK